MYSNHVLKSPSISWLNNQISWHRDIIHISCSITFFGKNNKFCWLNHHKLWLNLIIAWLNHNFIRKNLPCLLVKKTTIVLKSPSIPHFCWIRKYHFCWQNLITTSSFFCCKAPQVLGTCLAVRQPRDARARRCHLPRKTRGMELFSSRNPQQNMGKHRKDEKRWEN